MEEMYTGSLYWPATKKHVPIYPALKGTVRKQAAIIGGGISGALCAYQLASQGISSVVLERESVCAGSTLANAGMLQYSSDIMLHELIDQIGQQAAVRFYAACRHAVDQLGRIAGKLSADCGYNKRSSLCFASTEQHLSRLEKEYRTLRLYGFDTDYLYADELQARFPFRKSGALLTHGDGELNPYTFVHAVLDAAVGTYDVEVYEQTDVVLHAAQGGKHRLESDSGSIIEADYVIYAIGYEPEELRGQLIRPELSRSFACVTEPQSYSCLQAWPDSCLIWETARPYLYLRTLPDRRILIGGLDEAQPEPVKSKQDLQLRTHQLQDRLLSLFPSFNASIAYAWSATFGRSQDNLPFIGEDPSWPGVFYCLGYGGNGTVYSMLAADIIKDRLLGSMHPAAEIVRLDRTSLIANRI